MTVVFLCFFTWKALYAQADSPASEFADSLIQLSKLFEKGLLTAEEFSTAKARLLEMPETAGNNNGTITADKLTDNTASQVKNSTAIIEEPTVSTSAGLAVIKSEASAESELSGQKGTETDFKSILLIQGNVLGMPSSSIGRAVGAIAGSAVNIATGGIAGVAADIAVQSLSSSMLIDRKINQLLVPAVVTNEITRQLVCDTGELDGGTFDYIDIANEPLPEEMYAKMESLTLDDAKEMWADYFRLNTEWQLNESDNVFWVIYEILADRESVGEDLNQLKIEAATFSLGVYDPSMQLESTSDGHFLWLSKKPLVRDFSPITFHEFVSSWITKEIFSNKNALDSSCSARSMILNRIDQSLDSESDLEEIENFFESLGITAKRDRVRRSYKAVYEPDFSINSIDSSVSIEIFYERGRPRTFSSATVMNLQ
jgi:hypothetical protein